MIKNYVLTVLIFCAILYTIIFSELVITETHYTLFGVIFPVLMLLSIFFFKVKEHGFITNINSLCTGVVLYGILFMLIELAKIPGGWEALGAVMFALYAIVITVIANSIVWVRERYNVSSYHSLSLKPSKYESKRD